MYEDIGHSNEARKTMKKYLIGSLEVHYVLTPALSIPKHDERPQIQFMSQNQAIVMTSTMTLCVILRTLQLN